ncbi:hypothetical protein QKU48_gp1309 [Fadolivirus algeromassiliense]|jgi:hypothetical protein|uniref:Uncharacterized protein n=1 Tax=Fadolivirus FV1/VV64 TaxID=3070911 RepID=A0A7D3QVB3_9VIRU|nr:hypothetical protein QKU48_gp1309 [Fadolivirus algeromassiliense]QKF94767.1 hypothetical protein Fadolivirus_1_1309 [Fadolivirus FV1/VV64]
MKYFFLFITILVIITSFFKSEIFNVFEVDDQFNAYLVGNVQLNIQNQFPLFCTFSSSQSPIKIYVHYSGLKYYHKAHYIDSWNNKTLELHPGNIIKMYNNDRNYVSIVCE